MIPEMDTNIKYISMKLDENERSSTSRLMKVKDMMLEEERQKSEQKRLEREKARKAQRQAAE
jgi:V/A-type H+-transporting ATPase subunit D